MKIVLCEWEDAVFELKSDLDSIMRSPVIVRTYGELVEHNKRYIIIRTSASGDSGDYFRIPRPLIRKLTTLK